MNRPWFIWTASALCLVVGLGALAWVSAVVARLDRENGEAARQAAFEQQVRLALWRIESALSPLIGREHARPHFQYEAFYPVEAAYTNMYAPLEYGDVLVPSPLLAFESKRILLHFQIDGEGALASPQVPAGNMLDLAQARFEADRSIERATERLERLRGIVPVATMTATAATVPIETEPAEARVATGARRGRRRDGNDYAGRQRANAQNRNLGKVRSGIQTQQLADSVRAVESRPGEVSIRRVSEGDSRAFWIERQLLLLRRVVVGDETVVQGCWFDWPVIEAWLLGEIADLLPAATLVPVLDGDRFESSRMVAALPIALLAEGAPTGAIPLSRPVRDMLAVAWAGVLVAVGAVLVMIRATVTLSERRGAFVSAVTHELRTPLTTFRLYTQMLDEQMIPDEAKRRDYVRTLRAESDRLGHLVENVLTFARLERTNRADRSETVTIDDLVDRMRQRLEHRCAQAGTMLIVDVDDHARGSSLSTDVAAVDRIVFNLVDNACKYAGKGEELAPIRLCVHRDGGEVAFSVRDEGPGLGPEARRHLFRPFSKSARAAAHSAPGIGLGLALSRRLARSIGGTLRLVSSEGVGCAFELRLNRDDQSSVK
ncbi:MAG: histidine kinase [Phycisphaeraceae bacterium]|nr:histidine kinase [Phycisphaeraceae bacterium]